MSIKPMTEQEVLNWIEGMMARPDTNTIIYRFVPEPIDFDPDDFCVICHRPICECEDGGGITINKINKGVRK